MPAASCPEFWHSGDLGGSDISFGVPTTDVADAGDLVLDVLQRPWKVILHDSMDLYVQSRCSMKFPFQNVANCCQMLSTILKSEGRCGFDPTYPRRLAQAFPIMCWLSSIG